MPHKLEKNLLKARIIAWIIFAIPVIIFIAFSIQFLMFLNSEEWHIMLTSSGENAQRIVSIIAVSGVAFFSVFSVSWWFVGHYFIERSKNKILRRELARSTIKEVYPERLEDLKTL